MIKERVKITKYNYKKPVTLIIAEYMRTVMLSMLFAAVFTTILSIHARNVMIKNYYDSINSQSNMNKELAMQLINTSDNMLSDMQSKSYALCLQIGNIYEAAGEYDSALMAYKFAVEKSKQGDYTALFKLIKVLVTQDKFDEAEEYINSVADYPEKKLIKFKTRAYLLMGDKYYSIGKFISAAKHYEKADFYYGKFKKKDKVVDESIKKRIINAYLQSADEMVKRGYNSEAVRYLKKAEAISPEDTRIKYKLGIVLADLDPENSVKYLEPLLEKIPQNIDYGVYCSALMKAANIADLEGRSTQAKYYRYKIHSIDLFIKRKVVYKNDIDTILTSFTVKKVLFTYPLKATYSFINTSNSDIKYLWGDFVLSKGDEPLETYTTVIADKSKPLLTFDRTPNDVNIKFKRPIFTKKELENYTVKIYLYKDEKFKTLVAETKIPNKTYKNN